MSSPQLFLFTGENAYALAQERRSWAFAFTAKHGSENFSLRSARDVSHRELLDETGVAPFLAEKRLLVIDGIPNWSKEEMILLCENLHPSTVLLFCEPKPDKRLSSVKELLARATVKQFAPLSPNALMAWVTATATAHGISFASGAVDRLITIAGSDQSMLLREIEKLAMFAASQPDSEGPSRVETAAPQKSLLRTVTALHVDRLVPPSGEQDVWEITNLLCADRPAEALRALRGLLTLGEDPHALWNRLLWVLKSLVRVAAFVREGERSPKNLANLAGIGFLTARALAQCADQTNLRALSAFVDRTAKTDRDLKTGVLRTTREEPEELLAVIDQFILDFGKLKTITTGKA